MIVHLLLACLLASAGQWPEFRGPTGQGHAIETGVPLEWSESRNVVWKTPVPGRGWSSPVVADGRIWLTTSTESVEGRRRGVSLRLLAFDILKGREVVNAEVFRIDRPEPLNGKNSYASPTPIVDGDRVYVHFGAQGTAALTASGEVVWRTRLDYQSQHGNGGSPVRFNDLLIINCDGNGGDGDAYVVALDVKTGKTRWKAARRSPADQAYTTPLVVRAGDRDQIVSVGAYRTVSYDPANGSEIWRVSYEDGFSNVPRPVYGQGLVFIATGFQQPSLIAVRPDGSGDVTRSHVAWTLRRGAPLTPSPILVGEQLFIVNDTGIATCVDARTGTIHWQQRLGGNYSASPVYADGRIYFPSEEGVTTVIEPGTTFKRLAVNQLDGAILASMAVADRSFFIRTQSHLYRIGFPSNPKLQIPSSNALPNPKLQRTPKSQPPTHSQIPSSNELSIPGDKALSGLGFGA
jgi:outer membrane protein assembly factor BamB